MLVTGHETSLRLQIHLQCIMMTTSNDSTLYIWKLQTVNFKCSHYTMNKNEIMHECYIISFCHLTFRYISKHAIYNKYIQLLSIQKGKKTQLPQQLYSCCNFFQILRNDKKALTCLKFVTALITGEAVTRRISSDGKLIANLILKRENIW